MKACRNMDWLKQNVFIENKNRLKQSMRKDVEFELCVLDIYPGNACSSWRGQVLYWRRMFFNAEQLHQPPASNDGWKDSRFDQWNFQLGDFGKEGHQQAKGSVPEALPMHCPHLHVWRFECCCLLLRRHKPSWKTGGNAFCEKKLTIKRILWDQLGTGGQRRGKSIRVCFLDCLTWLFFFWNKILEKTKTLNVDFSTGWLLSIFPLEFCQSLFCECVVLHFIFFPARIQGYFQRPLPGHGFLRWPSSSFGARSSQWSCGKHGLHSSHQESSQESWEKHRCEKKNLLQRKFRRSRKPCPRRSPHPKPNRLELGGPFVSRQKRRRKLWKVTLTMATRKVWRWMPRTLQAACITLWTTKLAGRKLRKLTLRPWSIARTSRFSSLVSI